MWDSICYKTLGSTAYTGDLMTLNQEYRGLYTFPAGVVLTLPEPQESVIETLPPWKRAVG